MLNILIWTPRERRRLAAICQDVQLLWFLETSYIPDVNFGHDTDDCVIQHVRKRYDCIFYAQNLQLHVYAKKVAPLGKGCRDHYAFHDFVSMSCRDVNARYICTCIRNTLEYNDEHMLYIYRATDRHAPSRVGNPVPACCASSNKVPFPADLHWFNALHVFFLYDIIYFVYLVTHVLFKLREPSAWWVPRRFIWRTFAMELAAIGIILMWPLNFIVICLSTCAFSLHTNVLFTGSRSPFQRATNFVYQIRRTMYTGVCERMHGKIQMSVTPF